jgi:hypothetical protein
MKVWKMVKKMLPFFGARPFLRMISGSIRTSASSGKAENALKAWSARMLRSARNRMRGRRAGSLSRFQSARFHRLWNSLQASWKAMKVLLVPVARVSRMRS